MDNSFLPKSLRTGIATVMTVTTVTAIGMRPAHGQDFGRMLERAVKRIADNAIDEVEDAADDYIEDALDFRGRARERERRARLEQRVRERSADDFARACEAATEAGREYVGLELSNELSEIDAALRVDIEARFPAGSEELAVANALVEPHLRSCAQSAGRYDDLVVPRRLVITATN